MKGDFTRFTFDPEKHYRKVLKQQGRAELDADWNEQAAIHSYVIEESTKDTVGTFGVPKGDAFSVSPNADATDFLIQPGKAYVDGILCELEGTGPGGTGPILYTQQKDYVPLPPLAPVENRTDLVYLDVWERHVTAAEDADIREPALGGADTTTRVKTVVQVKIKTDVQSISCEDVIQGFPPQSRGLLSTSADPALSTPTSCLLASAGGYRGLENRLYRVEIHEGGDLNTATFKWSRDNGAIVFPVKSLAQAGTGWKVELKSLGKDQVLTVHKGDWVEVIDERTDLMNESGTLAEVLNVDPQTRVLELDGDLSKHSTEPNARVRRWDMEAGPLNLTNGGNPIHLEDGVRVEFSVDASITGATEDFSPGDYWCFTARTGSAGLEMLDKAPCRGIKHHYARLAFITWKKEAGKFQPVVDDRCRRRFPSLTNICAEDVCFDGAACQMAEITNVQEALDALCNRECCTLTVRDTKPGWEKVFETIPPGGGIVCFPPGEYTVPETITITGKGPLVLLGAGESTKIVAAKSECAVVFENCGSIAVRDMAIRAQSAEVVKGAGDGIRGVFDFRNCWSVTLERLTMTCADGVRRAAACVSIHGNAGRDFDVRVLNCRMSVGVQQSGILIVNATRILVDGNTIEGRSTTLQKKPQFLTNLKSRAELRKPLLSNLMVNAGQTKGPKPNVETTVAGKKVQFQTTSSLVNAWKQLLAENPPKANASQARVVDHIYRLADSLLMAKEKPGFKDVVEKVLQSVVCASQGVAVGGTRTEDVRIHNNVISGCMQGIHIGLSQSGPRTEANVKSADRVRVSGNTVRLVVAPGATRERHGIFVGNAQNILIRDNMLSLEKAPVAQNMPVDGVRVFGYFGRFIMVRDNSVEGFTVGVRVTPRGAIPKSPVWRVVENAILSPSQEPVKASPPVVKTPNFS